MQRYFAKDKLNNEFILQEDDLYHIRTVMRMRSGERVEVVYDSDVYLCNLDIDKSDIRVLIISCLEKEENREEKSL